jgi:hypothetical protein
MDGKLDNVVHVEGMSLRSATENTGKFQLLQVLICLRLNILVNVGLSYFSLLVRIMFVLYNFSNFQAPDKTHRIRTCKKGTLSMVVDNFCL